MSKKEDHRYILLLLPLAVIPDLDTFLTLHRALLHNIFIPLILLLFGLLLKEKRTMFNIGAVYTASHVFMDMFDGGVVLFYPFYNQMAFVDAGLRISRMNELTWTFNYGFEEYSTEWMSAYGYISDSIGTGALTFILLAGVCVACRRWIKREH
ncbi:MAG: hypothetical protein M5U10_03575 [Candidatus Methanoperedens sp.]|uniref:hypothetical protein n=1 Tax=Candidatus Methanoperedens nitratireducens TaxID=1392998 RepID=UPI0012FF32A9|nr:hypothetical protein [Candidatus Methanoperedens nitroreducens]MDJ1420979.1 hypothetical protein [Candidatus Methanoperedens sp.]